METRTKRKAPAKKINSPRPGNTSRSKRQRRESNLTEKEIALIQKVDQWIGEAITRERLGEKVFVKKERGDIVENICGIKKQTLFYKTWQNK